MIGRWHGRQMWSLSDAVENAEFRRQLSFRLVDSTKSDMLTQNAPNFAAAYLFSFCQTSFNSRRQSFERFSNLNRHEILSLKVPNMEFDFDVSVDIIQLQTDTSKSNSMLGSKLWVLIVACKWVCFVFDVCVRSWILSTDTGILKTLHRSRIRRLILSVICVYDQGNGWAHAS